MMLEPSSSMGANNALSRSNAMVNQSMSRLATGRQLQRASDNAANMQMVERMTSEIRGSQRAIDSLQTGSNVLNIADGAMNQSTDLLQRARELALQAAGSVMGPEQRNTIQAELEQIGESLNQIAETTQFNGTKLLDGSVTSYNIVADAEGAMMDVSEALSDISAAGLGFTPNVSTGANAQATIDAIDGAMSKLNDARGNMGSMVNSMEMAVNNAQTSVVNRSTARSRMQDTNYASEMSRMVQSQMMQNIGTFVSMQTSRMPGTVASSLLSGLTL
jgi:flagellin